MEKEGRKGQAVGADDTGGEKTDGSGVPVLVVGIGAGAGSLKSLKKILSGLPFGKGAAFFLIHHPEITKSNLFKLLEDQTALEVVEAADGMAVLADRVYVMPPDKFLNIARGRLTLTAPVHCDGLLMPIDHFFCSLAADRQKRCCVILLSGRGGDGTLGLSEIRAAGGRTIVQDPKETKISDMPQSAIDAGVADTVLPVDAIAGAIAEFAGQVIAMGRSDQTASPVIETGLTAILDILRVRAGHDFGCYKPGTLVRRIHRRMMLGNIATMDDYARHLSDNPDEVGLLRNDLLIGVTDFFRQPLAWHALEKMVIAPLLEGAGEGSEIRVWVPGCASGKEVYSLAMLLAEQAEGSGGKANFQIFATDTDFTALAKARTGIYAPEELGDNLSEDRLKRFFSRRDGRYQVIKGIREWVVFAAQNLTADPPFSRLDLIICRNLLIYLDQQAQRKVIALFHFALRDGGLLFLGNAETVGDREDLFEPVSKKWRIYRRIGVGHHANVEIPSRPSDDVRPLFFKSKAAITMPRSSLASIAQQTLLARFAPACVIIDRKLHVLYVHGMIENYLTIPAGELTTRIVEMAREGLQARLRGAIAKCIETGRPVAFTARTRRGEKSVPVKATVSLLRHLRETDGLLLITFEDHHFPSATSGGQSTVNGDLRQLADELKITREELQSAIDQLEVSNDQFKASNEEVTAANEELQSANEEMETSKEELQSLNEELNTINLRLHEKVDELEIANNDVVNLLASTSIATLFLDKQFRIKRFTPAANRLMSLIPSDLGRPIGDILLRFTDETLLDDARRVLVDLAPISREVQADDGIWYIRRIMPYRTQDDRIEGVVLTFVDVAEIKQAEEALREALVRTGWLARLPGENPNPVMRTSAEGTILYCNPASMKNGDWACSVGDPLPDPVRTLVPPAMESGKELHREVQLGENFYAVTLTPFPKESYVNVYGRSITKRKRAEEEIRRSEARLKRAQEIAHLGSWELDLTDNRLIWSDEVYRIFGLEPQEFTATYEAFLERVHPDDRGAVDDAYSGSIRENRDAYEIDHRVVRNHTGEIRFVHERCQHIRDASGTIIRSIGMVHDITERKRAEEALRKLNSELEERVAAQTAEIRKSYEAMAGERQRFYNVLESLPAYVVLLAPDYHVPFANRFFRERFGESHGKRCYEYLFQRTEPCEICETYTVLSTGKPHHWEWTGPDNRDYDVHDFPFTDSDGAPFILEMGIDVTETKRAQAALREANETLERRVAERTAELEAASAEAEAKRLLLESVMEVLPVGVSIVDATGRTINSNRAFEEVWGAPRPPVDSFADYTAYKAWWSETGEPVRPEEWASARAVQTGEAVSGQLFEIERFDGSRVFVLNSASPVLDTRGKIVGGAVAIQDVTALRRAEEALRESEKRVRLKLRSILDPEGEIGDLELADIIDVPAIQSLMDDIYALTFIPMSIMDLRGRLLVGVGWQDICLKFHRVHPETCKHCLECDTQLSAGIPPGKSRLYRCKNNMWDVATPIMVGGKHVGNVFSGQFFFDDETLDLDLFRSQARRLGFNEEEYLAAVDRVPRLSREKMETGMAFFMKLAEWISQISYSNLTLARLLTERKQAAEVLQEQTRQLEAANRELEDFSYTVSHDLRAPLRAIDGYSRMILRKNSDKFDEDTIDKFNVIRNNTRMMGQLIDDLLAFSRLGRTQLSKAALNFDDLIKEVWEEVKEANPDRRLTLKIAELPPCRADRGLIKQVLVNLLSNSVKFTRGREEAVIEAGGCNKDGEIVYSIRDNGVGFDMQYHDKLFGVFQRLHSADEFEGTGVGLAIVQRIIHRHGGRIRAEGEIGKGACFWFSLPV